MSHILIIDDEEAVCWALERALTRAGHTVAVAASAERGFERLAQRRPDAAILDVRLPGLDGLSALSRFRLEAGDMPVIVMTAFGNLSTAVKAVEGGAFDYLTKPFDLDQALAAIDRALQARQRQDAATAEAAPLDMVAEELVGQSPAMQDVFKRIALVAPREACVLITGESGTGKELVARAIHRHSSRRHRPFLPIHVAALNPSLVESELFGHVKGAFTGAVHARPGLLALAEGGTVFLDELADIPLPVQVKLLRVLEHSEVLPVGGNQPATLNIRILAATHQDLAPLVVAQRFRHDLYFRLNVFPIHLPPLRQRAEDIVPLASHFLKHLQPRALPLPAETIRFLTAAPWPGNVRELRNALEHATILARGGPLQPEHFPVPDRLAMAADAPQRLQEAVRGWLADQIRAHQPEAPADLYAACLKCVEPVLLADVLERVRGNRWLAARWLGLNRATVRKKLGLYKMASADGTPETEAEEPPDAP